MNRKTIWLSVICCISLVLGLIAASCKSTNTPVTQTNTGTTSNTSTAVTSVKTTTKSPTVTAAATNTITDSLGRTVEKPQYGGIMTVSMPNDPIDFDEVFANTWQTWTLGLTNSPLIMQDWRVGPSGTGEADIMRDTYYVTFPYPTPSSYIMPMLCESWEFPSPGVQIFHLRQGVHFQNKAPVNGREVTSTDVVYSIKRMYETPGTWLYQAHEPIKYETPDKYTVKLTFDSYDSYDSVRSCSITYTVPKEIVDLGGKGEGLRNWKNACGTGPYLFTDYIIGNSLTFTRNPDYFEMDPFIPGNRLPYIDTFNILIIADPSTQLAALRTGKLDQRPSSNYQQHTDLASSDPNLMWRNVNGQGALFYVPNNVKPYSDIKVRSALSMALDRDTIINDFYHKAATKLAWMVLPANVEYTPIDQMPADTKALFTYNPTQAKQLLTEAGYSKGFQMTLTVPSAPVENVDLVNLCAVMWQNIGLDVKVEVLESAVYNSKLYAHQYTNPLFGTWLGAYIESGLDAYRTGMGNNHNLVSDPKYDAMCVAELGAFDPAERNKLAKELNLYALSQSWCIPLPSGDLWCAWQPWLKRYSGEEGMGYCHIFHQFTYAWIDQTLKTKLTK